MSNYRDSTIFKQSDRKWKKNALIGSYFSNDLSLIAQGYYKGAKILVESLDNNPSNALVYPIVFLYRHYIEIQLKAILEEFREMGAISNRIMSHKLDVLLKRVNQICTQQSLQNLSDEVCETIQGFNEFDNSSQTFRYSINRNGVSNIPEHDTLGLETLKTVMVIVESELYGLHLELRETNKTNQEIHREHDQN